MAYKTVDSVLNSSWTTGRWEIAAESADTAMATYIMSWDSKRARLIELTRVVFQNTASSVAKLAKELNLNYYTAYNLFRADSDKAPSRRTHTPLTHAKMCVAILKCGQLKASYSSIKLELVQHLFEALKVLFYTRCCGDRDIIGIDNAGVVANAIQYLSQLSRDPGIRDDEETVAHITDIVQSSVLTTASTPITPESMPEPVVVPVEATLKGRRKTSTVRNSDVFLARLRREIDEEPLLKGKHKEAFKRIIDRVLEITSK